MTRRNDIVDRYVAMFNEPDEDIRRKMISELYAPNAVYTVYTNGALEGHEAIEGQVTYAHEEFHKRGFVFKSSNNALGHHQLVKFNWVAVSVETGEVEALCTDVFVLDDAGRIQADHQFHDKIPRFAVVRDLEVLLMGGNAMAGASMPGQ